MAKAIIWCRVSTTEQEFYTQQADLIKKAQSDGFLERDLIIIGEAGASAIKMNEVYQKEVNQLINTINTVEGVTTIYVWEVSRLARNEVAFYQMKDKIIRSHIQLICFVPQLTLLDSNGEVNTGSEITLNLLVTLAKQEMEIKSKRFARGKKRMADEGKYNGGHTPYGYKVNPDTKKIEVDEEKAAMIREVFNMYERGMSTTKVAIECYERGWLQFTFPRVIAMLHNERYTGKKHKYPKCSYERQYPAIITQEQYDRCREIARNNINEAPKEKRVYYAKGLIVCSQCGSRFTSSGSKVDYRCYSAFGSPYRIKLPNVVKKCDNKVHVSINIVDSLLWHLAQEAELRYIIDSAAKDMKAYTEKMAVLEEKLRNIGARMEDLDKKRKRIVEAYIEGDITKEMRDKKFQNIEKSRREIQQEQMAYENERQHIEALLGDMSERYDLEHVDDIEHNLDRMMELRQRIASIEDDKMRSEIVHRHIQKMTVDNVDPDTVPQLKNGRVMIRFMTIWFYNGEVKYYYFRPYSGRNGSVIESDEHGNVYGQVDFEFLPRFLAPDKEQAKLRRQQHRREAQETAYPKERYAVGCQALADYLGISYGKAYGLVAQTKELEAAVVGKYRERIVLDKAKCVELLRGEAESGNKAAKRVVEKLEENKSSAQ